ncbi:MAG: polymer-forming cytoskeletal protein [Bacteroidales bacterium]|nr:polymer-forming cytoskeletal protein [Bacteroidales bacterium]
MNISSKIGSSPVVDVNDVSHISAGTIVKGEISSLTDIRIDGTVQGKIFSRGKVVVGESASVSGTLACSNVDYWGKMEGDIYVKDTLSLKGTASLNGNIHVRKFQVEMGAQINGTCAMITEEDYEKFVQDVITTEVPSSE